MDLKHHIFLGNQFGTKTVGNYILRYTSKEEKTESLEISNYITRYTPRLDATEALLESGETLNKNLQSDIELSRKDGVMFGNRGLSYSDETLKYAAKTSQKASEQGHIAILPVISFTHEFLIKKGLVDKDMPPPKDGEDGIYKGKVDQLKLRMAITEMMERCNREMGFNKPEWTATIQFDTGNVHAHITSIETSDTPNKKRLKQIYCKKGEYLPDMKWKNNSNKSEWYTVHKNDEDLIEYRQDGRIVAKQNLTDKGNPKWRRVKTSNTEMKWEEAGKINEKIKSRMRETLNRSLSKTKDIKPFVNEIENQKRTTKELTINTIYYNDKVTKKLQGLAQSLPDNRKMWRAGSNAKVMERPHEIANEIIDDIWTNYRSGVGIDEFDNSVKEYSHLRQKDENLSDEKKEEFERYAYQKLRTESLNAIYKVMKDIKPKDKDTISKQATLISVPTDELREKISLDYHDDNKKHVNRDIHKEYRKRSNKERYQDAHYNMNKYKRHMDDYDFQNKKQKTSGPSKVVRAHYQQEYEYNKKQFEKYNYLTSGHNKSDEEKKRFNEVKGVDLINMLYDYNKGDDRSVPKEIAEEYQIQSHARKNAVNQTLDYLIDTGQYEQYEVLREKRDAIRKEADISDQIKEELEIPIPEKTKNESNIEYRQTIDTIQGRRLLKEEIKSINQITKDLNKDYDIKQLNTKNDEKDNVKTDYNVNAIDFYKMRRQHNHETQLMYNGYYKESEEEEKAANIIRETLQIDEKPETQKDIELDL